MIKPTIGRVIWYWPIPAWSHRVLDAAQAFKADVVFVHTDDTINVSGYDHFGNPFSDMGVQILEGEHTKAIAYAQWMPYQKAVAAGERPNQHVSPETPSGAS